MIRTSLAALAALALAAPLAAQSTSQEDLEARYDRALAAGYKALFLCSALANAQRNGVERTPESVEQWDLTGPYPRIQSILSELEYRILRDAAQRVAHVEVDWAEDMPPRFAKQDAVGSGCRLAPIGLPIPQIGPVAPNSGSFEVDFRRVLAKGELVEIGRAAFDEQYGSGIRTSAVVIRRGGRNLVVEYIDNENRYPQRTWSVAKSIAATLVGAAVQRGEAKVTDALAFDEWRWDERRTITIDHFLRMASGRYTDTPGNRTDPLYMGGALVEESATGWPLLHPPGTVFRYANKFRNSFAVEYRCLNNVNADRLYRNSQNITFHVEVCTLYLQHPLIIS